MKWNLSFSCLSKLSIQALLCSCCKLDRWLVDNTSDCSRNWRIQKARQIQTVLFTSLIQVPFEMINNGDCIEQTAASPTFRLIVDKLLILKTFSREIQGNFLLNAKVGTLTWLINEHIRTVLKTIFNEVFFS